ncbi:ladderlectin-like [Cyprinodon tularosa]|uniref:ladderlectin-like n=1 Tax=Cyprinodon tularosa TaxID=77115 RepID=UPI0018E21E3F|nr:ladderlectin-like [Cyprinodon tularosa]
MMLLFFLFGLSLAAETPSERQRTPLLRGNCNRFWYSFDNNCYKYVATLMTWADAEKYCNTQGANLVSIHSLKEENFVKDLITNFDPAEGVNWIGLSDAQQDRAYFWSDGSPLDFTLWNAGEPNNAGGTEPCVHTNWGPVKKWNDKVCAEKYSFVCKARQVCQ